VSAPLVSVCIATYQGEPHVAETIRSVLGQTLDDLEVIVSDDASTDGTLDAVEAVADDRVVVRRHSERFGGPGNWWRAVAGARGRYVKLMGQDDLLAPRCLEQQAAALADPGVALATCRRRLIDEDGAVVRRAHGLWRLHGRVPGAVARRRIVSAGTNPVGEPVAVLARRDQLIETGPFRAEAGYVADLDKWLHLLDAGDLFGDPDPLVSFRVHAGSWTADVARQQGPALRRLLRDEARRRPSEVRPWHLARGLAASEVIAAARRVVYRRSR
jgi:glycosyltransferase involved in cell wall biosynthesis